VCIKIQSSRIDWLVLRPRVIIKILFKPKSKRKPCKSFRTAAGFAEGAHPQVPDDEITWEIVKAMRDTNSSVVEPTGPASTADASPQSSPIDQGASWLTNTNYLVIGAVVAAVAVAAVVLVVLRKRKRHLA